MLQKQSKFKNKFRGLSWKIFNILENNNNSNFEKNGERIAIENLFKYFKNKGGGESDI